MSTHANAVPSWQTANTARFGIFGIRGFQDWENIFSEWRPYANSTDGFQNTSLKRWILSLITICPSFSRRYCIVFGDLKWCFPVNSPLLLTTRCAGTSEGQECIAQPTILALIRAAK
jgi:hypothetical protein